jgi:hypothetical protein
MRFEHGNAAYTYVGGNYFWTKMNIEQAKKIGQRETLKWTLYTFLIGELIFMFLETRGDFANGIIFFIEGHKNIHYLVMVAILFTVTYFSGQRNGTEILILGRHFYITPFKYGLLTIWVVLVYGSTVGLLKQNDKDSCQLPCNSAI